MPEVTKNYVHIPKVTPKKNAKIVTISISDEKGIKALYDTKNREIVTWLFSTEKWDMKKAKKWAKDHASIYELLANVYYAIDDQIRSDLNV